MYTPAYILTRANTFNGKMQSDHAELDHSSVAKNYIALCYITFYT